MIAMSEVTECDRPQVHELLSVVGHVGDIELVADRRGCRPKLPVGVDEDNQRVRYAGGDAANAGDESAALSATSTDADGVYLVGDAAAVADVDVVVTGGGDASNAGAEDAVVVAGRILRDNGGADGGAVTDCGSL